MALGTTVVWGGTSPVAKLIAASGVSQISVMCYRGIFVSLVLGAYLYRKKGMELFLTGKRMCGKYALMGMLTLVLNATGFMMSCTYLSVPQALILHYTFPLVTMLCSVFVTKEKPSAVQILSGFFVVLGLWVGFAHESIGDKSLSAVGILWGVVSVIGLAGQTLLSRQLSKTNAAQPLEQLFYSHFWGGLILIIWKTFFIGWADLSFMTPRIFVIIHYPTVVSGLIGFGLLFSALRYISASTASMICSMEIVFALLLTPLILHQTPALNEIAGCGIILASVVCSVLSAKQ